MELTVDGVAIATKPGGFLADAAAWNENVAQAIAALEGVALSEAHWEIIRFMRAYYQEYRHLPNARQFTKAVQKTLGDAKGNNRYLHNLFPDGPLRLACKIGGLPKPPGCLT